MIQQYDNWIMDWQNEIANHLYHPTLVQYTGVPKLNTLRMIGLFLPLLNNEKQDNMPAYYATAIIYLALSSHDHVNETGTPSKEQQLRVLAGDYYSGKYYQLLAQSEQVGLISKLTDSIRMMTEAKTLVYERPETTREERREARLIIASAPTVALFDEVNMHAYTDLSRLIGYVALLMEVSDSQESPHLKLVIEQLHDKLSTTTLLNSNLVDYIRHQIINE